MPTPASQTASIALLLLTTLGASVAAENVGIEAKVTDAVCSNGLTLNDYSIQCLDDNGNTTACGFGRSANIYANVYLESDIPQDEDEHHEDDDDNGDGIYVAVKVEGCLGHNCNSFVDAKYMQVCVDNGEGEGEGEDNQDYQDNDDMDNQDYQDYDYQDNDDMDGQDNQDYQDNDDMDGERRLSSSAEGYTFLSSGGQGCGEAGAYDISVSGFKLDTFGISDRTWGYGGKAVTLLLTLSHYSQDADDEEGDALGYCEITLKTGHNPPQMAIVGVVTAVLCSLVFCLAYTTEKRKSTEKRRSNDDEKANDYDSMTDSDGDSSADTIDNLPTV